MNKVYTILLAALALFSGASCTLDEEPVSQGCITLTLSTSAVETKAGNGNPADGGGILVNNVGAPDLVIAIVDRNDNIVAWYPENYGSVAGGTSYESSCSSSHTASTPTTESIIVFSGLVRGNYTVFAVANTVGLSAVGRLALSRATTLTDLQNLLLSVDSGTPTFPGAMPLSASGTLVVTGNTGEESGQIELNLKRVVARVSMIFKNLTESALNLDNCTVTLHTINPSKGYLFERATDYVSGYDRDLQWPATNITVPVVDLQDPESVNTYPLASMLVFPSTAPLQPTGRRYVCDISFAIGEENHSFSDLPVYDRRSADILALCRNQDLIIETTISQKGDVQDISFNFVVKGWDKKEEYVVFH